jgi:type I restriction enzyme S subunit
MKEGWEYKTIGDLCDKINGLWKGKTEPFVNVGVIRNANFTKSFTLSFDNIEYLDVEAKQYKTRKLQIGDLIVEKSGGSEKQPVGRTVLFDREEGEYSFSNFTSVLRIKDREVISPEFLYKYILFVYLRGDTRKMQKATTGIHNIEFDKFLSIPVPKIPLSEQQTIVDYLDSAFAKIDAMKANAEKALNEAKALFQASLKEMLEPKEGWEEKTLGEMCDIVSVLVNPAEEKYKNLLHVGGANITSESGELIELKTAAEEGLISGKFLFNEEDVLYNKIRPYLKKVARPYFSGLCSADMYPLRHKDGITRDYLYYVLTTKDYTEYAIKNSGRAGMPKVNRQAVFAYNFFLPSLSEQQSIVETLDSLKSKVDKLQENFDKISQECDALKQAILRQVFE